jgi:hypothetical protein
MLAIEYLLRGLEFETFLSPKMASSEAVSPTFPRSFLLRKKIEVHTSTSHTLERPTGACQHNICVHTSYLRVHTRMLSQRKTKEVMLWLYF